VGAKVRSASTELLLIVYHFSSTLSNPIKLSEHFSHTHAVSDNTSRNLRKNSRV